MRYLAASIVIAAAAAVYGLFSHGVYSYFMTYAFMIPLLGGALPHLIAAMKNAHGEPENSTGKAEIPAESEGRAGFAKIFDAKDTQLAVIATLTAGSLLKGVLDIYGTTNSLLLAYPVMAAAICVAWAAVMLRKTHSTDPPFTAEKQ
jgi:hypothetical protein